MGFLGGPIVGGLTLLAGVAFWVYQNMDSAADHYRRAADGGDFRGRFNHARMLADADDVDGALLWLARVGETATPAFMEKATAWLAASENERLRTEGIAALRRGDSQ